MPPRLYLCLITLEDLILLLIYLVNMLLCLFQPLLPILLRQRAFLLRNPASISFLFKYCPYYSLLIILTKYSQDSYLRRLTVFPRSCYLLDQLLLLRSIKQYSPANVLPFLRSKAVLNSVVDLIISISSLQADLRVYKISIKEKGLNTQPFILREFYYSRRLLRYQYYKY